VQADGIEIVRHAAETGFHDSAEFREGQIPARRIAVEPAERESRFLGLNTKGRVETPLNQSGAEAAPIELRIAGARLETAEKIFRKDNAGLDVFLLHFIEIEKGKLDLAWIVVGKGRE
jgi:hypothetical protein